MDVKPAFPSLKVELKLLTTTCYYLLIKHVKGPDSDMITVRLSDSQIMSHQCDSEYI